MWRWILLLILLCPNLLSAQTRRFCRADGTLIDISQGFTPREAAARLLDYYNYSGPSYSAYPPNPLQAASLQDGLKFLGFAKLESFQEAVGLSATGVLDYSTLGVLINKLKDSQELFGGNANCPKSPLVEPQHSSVTLKPAVCRRGYARYRDDCMPFAVPENANVDVTGHSWYCRMGFVAMDDTCAPVHVPENASLNFSGKSWICHRGYIKDNDSCVAVAVPLNASLSLSGNGWVCHRGFIPDGSACAPVLIPENAALNLSGTGWVCRLGFYKVEGGCLKSPSFVIAKLSDF